MNEREPAITEMIDLVQQADRKVRELSTTEDIEAVRRPNRRRSLRRALRRALKR